MDAASGCLLEHGVEKRTARPVARNGRGESPVDVLSGARTDVNSADLDDLPRFPLTVNYDSSPDHQVMEGSIKGRSATKKQMTRVIPKGQVEQISKSSLGEKNNSQSNISAGSPHAVEANISQLKERLHALYHPDPTGANRRAEFIAAHNAKANLSAIRWDEKMNVIGLRHVSYVEALDKELEANLHKLKGAVNNEHSDRLEFDRVLADLNVSLISISCHRIYLQACAGILANYDSLRPSLRSREGVSAALQISQAPNRPVVFMPRQQDNQDSANHLCRSACHLPQLPTLS
jgi:hypothetical protein